MTNPDQKSDLSNLGMDCDLGSGRVLKFPPNPNPNHTLIKIFQHHTLISYRIIPPSAFLCALIHAPNYTPGFIVKAMKDVQVKK